MNHNLPSGWRYAGLGKDIAHLGPTPYMVSRSGTSLWERAGVGKHRPGSISYFHYALPEDHPFFNKESSMTYDLTPAIELLDRRHPNWFNEINLDKLNMAEPDCCILGQLYNGYTDGTKALDVGCNTPMSELLGGQLRLMDRDDNRTLTGQWKEAILAKHRETTQSTPTDRFIVGQRYRVADWNGFCSTSITRRNVTRDHPEFIVEAVDSDGDAQLDGYTIAGLCELQSGAVIPVTTTKENTMNTQEAYKVLFEDFKARVPVGSTVRIARKWTNGEAERWGTCRQLSFFGYHQIGEEVEVGEYVESRRYALLKNGGGIPITCLEVVSTKPASIKVKLNDEYTAEVYKDAIVVGCQTIDLPAFRNLIAAHRKLSK